MSFPIETSSAEVLAKEAEKRGMVVERFYNIRSGYFRITNDDHSEILFQSQSNKLGRVTARIFTHKGLTSVFLREAGFPVPDDTIAQTEKEALDFLEKHDSIVLKPVNATGGTGVSIDLTESEQVKIAFAKAQEKNDNGETGVICQQQVSGDDFRIMVVDMQHVFVAERVPAHVIGDGTHTIEELIELHNSKEVEGYGIPAERIMPATLYRQGFAFHDTPDTGTYVQLMRAANSHLGGRVINADAKLGESAKSIAIDIAKHFNCPVLGLDCMTDDLTQSIGHIIELNEAPALYKHEYPDEGANQPVGSAIIDMLFPESIQ